MKADHRTLERINDVILQPVRQQEEQPFGHHYSEEHKQLAWIITRMIGIQREWV